MRKVALSLFAQLPEAAGAAGKLTEYGLVGVLMLVIIGIMTYLLKFVLDQARADRDTWKEQSKQFIAALEKITSRLEALGAELAHIREEVRK